MASLGVACSGPVERYRARAAATAGRTHAGIDHARRAVLACERLDHRPALALCLGQLAGLLAAGNHADRAEAGRHLDRARAIAGELGMDGWIDRWGPVSREVTPAVQFQRLDQGGWRVRLGDAVATLPDLAGVTYLAELARHPGREVPALSLIAPAAGGGSSRQVLLDRTALAQLKDRSTQLRARLDVCEPWERDRLEAELDQVLRTVREAVGMGEHARTFTDDEERARTAVRKAIVRAIAMLARVEPGIAGHLEATVRTGRQCRYDPTAV
jgi:hypothetical protein